MTERTGNDDEKGGVKQVRKGWDERTRRCEARSRGWK